MADQFNLHYVRHWRIFSGLVIKESHYFTEIIQELMSDDHYLELQRTIIRQPDIGNLIPGSGGLRKMRWKRPGLGKRGGIRVIYYWITKENQILMLYAYAKSKSENLTEHHIKQLRKIVEEELSNG